MNTEYEIVSYNKLKDIKVMLTNISYRVFHEHKDYEVFAVIKGRARIKMSTSEFIVESGSFAVFNSRAAHEIDAEGDEVTAIIIQFSPFLCREYYPHARRLMLSNANASETIDKKLNEEIMNHICGMAVNYFRDDQFFELKCLRDMMHLLVLISENLSCEYLNPEQYHNRVSKEYKINEITSYMDSRYQYPIRLEDVAKLVDMTPAYLSHFISKNLGFSFQDYLNNLRFEHALRQIDRELPLRDISAGSGFSDPKYLTKMFIKKTGMTPSKYRAKYKEMKNLERQRSMRNPRQFFYSEEQSLELVEAYIKSCT